MNCGVGVDGRITSPSNGPMDSVQVGKAVFVKQSYTTLGIGPKTYSYPGRCGYHNSVCWFLVFGQTFFFNNNFCREEEELLSGAPDEFLCPIMSILMTDPVSFIHHD